MVTVLKVKNVSEDAEDWGRRRNARSQENLKKREKISSAWRLGKVTWRGGCLQHVLCLILSVTVLEIVVIVVLGNLQESSSRKS
jgi:hypothetical protein